MSPSLGEVRRWHATGLMTARSAIDQRQATVEECRQIVSDGRVALDHGWDGVAADAVVEAAESEHRHLTALASGLADLAEVLANAERALGSALRIVRDRVTEAKSVGLVVIGEVVAPAPGFDVVQNTVDLHAAAIRAAVDTVTSLDEHYGREIDSVATRIHDATPPESDRSPIPGPDSPWPGIAVDALTGGVEAGAGQWGHELDPRTRGKRAKLPFSVDFMRTAGPLLRGIGRSAGIAGGVVTAWGGYTEYRDGQVTVGEAAARTTGAVGGGGGAGFAGGLVAGSWLGPPGALIGGALGAAAGSAAGKALGDAAHETLTNHHELLMEQYRYGI